MGIAWTIAFATASWAQAPGICPEGFLSDSGSRCMRWVPLGPTPEAVERIEVSARGIRLRGATRSWRRSVGGDWVPAGARPARWRPTRRDSPAPATHTVRYAIGWLAVAGQTVWRSDRRGAEWVATLPAPVAVDVVGGGGELVVVVGHGEVWALEQRSAGPLSGARPLADWDTLEAEAESAAATGSDPP